MTFTLDAEVAAVLEAALEENCPPPMPPVGDVQTRRPAAAVVAAGGQRCLYFGAVRQGMGWEWGGTVGQWLARKLGRTRN